MENIYQLPERGTYLNGHGVVCKHCGRSFDEHCEPDNAVDVSASVKGYGCSLKTCIALGYEPSDKEKWIQREKTLQEEEDNFVI